MEIDQNEQNPSDSNNILRNVFDDVYTSRSEPSGPFSYQPTYQIHNEQQVDETTTRVNKKLMKIDHNKHNIEQ